VINAGNVVSGNTGAGISIEGAGTSNQIQGDFVGTDMTGTYAVANGIGISLTASGNTVGGNGISNLISGNLGDGIYIAGNNNTVQYNTIGPDVSGFLPLGNHNNGVEVNGSGNQIGGLAGTLENIISANGNDGVYLNGSNNAVQGNGIGVNDNGSAGLPNNYGVYIQGGSNNTIGGTPGLGNSIAGNTAAGIYITNSAGNNVRGNTLGTDNTGTKAIPNFDGVYVAADASNTTIGGTTNGFGNLIAGNTDAGVYLAGAGNLVQNNSIGITSAGALPNNYGVYVTSSNNTIGGDMAVAGNLISGNTAAGIYLSGSGNQVQGDLIGTDATGMMAAGNGIGVDIAGGTNNTVGGLPTKFRNVIAGNSIAGVYITSNGNSVVDNYIGTSDGNTGAVGNGYGVEIVGGSNNTIGGTAAGAGNVIFYDAYDGVLVDTGTGNAIQGNAIAFHNN
jgi:parallel beta-helix repeat protein